jgi:26S proteasome regulatory subunit N10
VLWPLQLGGKADIAGAVQVAQLALKHRCGHSQRALSREGPELTRFAVHSRRNKNGGQRVVVFVASPIEADSKALIRVGKLLKKNGVAVDVISMGEIEENQQKLQVLTLAPPPGVDWYQVSGSCSHPAAQEFVDATNSNNNSHLVTIPAGLLPSDVIVTSPIIHGGEGEGAMPYMGGAPGGGGENTAQAPPGVDRRRGGSADQCGPPPMS